MHHNLRNTLFPIHIIVDMFIILLITISFIFAFNQFSSNPTIQLTAIVCLAIFWSLFYNPFRLILRIPFEKNWINDAYDAEDVIDNMAVALSPILDKTDAYIIIKKYLQNMLQIKNIDCYLLSVDQPDVFILIDSSIQNSINTYHPLPDYLRENKHILEINKIEHSIWKTISGISIHPSSTIIPLFCAGTLDGFIICGQKISGSSYSIKDLRLFNTIQKQALLVLDRIRPYGKIKKDFELNQKKLYETEKQLARSEKIASMANLLQEYNHEIRTPLGVIMGKIEDLLEDYESDKAIQDKGNTMMFHADRIRDIVDTTLRLSQPKKRNEFPVNINEIIKESIHLLPPDGIDLQLSLESHLNVLCDIDDMQTVFLNLIKNAKEAMENGGILSIKSFDRINESESLVVIEVSDTGIGISSDKIEQIWEPFVSRHVTKGRGLGLSIVFRIIREHMGNISVSSIETTGTTFTITLPVLKT
ncbi:MAG: hypothetical protein A2Y40_05025 [Candidatus Margulisbacteria bacterium GWF2_35_9]|nr:MAG: hypothetical protein A2Y40_05025 [Candidatus Margulisbacteria bacterium GWF2_35_9]